MISFNNNNFIFNFLRNFFAHVMNIFAKQFSIKIAAAIVLTVHVANIINAKVCFAFTQKLLNVF